ncbi:MAG: hypothetical protein DHS20C18_55470 [Saprospiraceae bacterium]|nr:MAG: hypothetical protein DHS20C18_55470 [Saprospiraceae bacterium]
MPYSSIRHTREDGSSMFSVLSLNVLRSLDSQKINALNNIGIATVADLLHYTYFYRAEVLINYSKGLVAHDLDVAIFLDNGLQNTPKEDIPGLPTSSLKGIGSTLEATLINEFQIQSIENLANFQPYQEAKRYLTPDDEVFNEPASAPEDLMPRILGGIHSTVRFNSFILSEEVDYGHLFYPYPNFVENFFDKDIIYMFGQQNWMPSIGYIAGLKQNWINHGTHLGEILHSMALAPGESRNIAIIEWYRRQSSSRDEGTNVDEYLANNLVHARALNEVTKATAQEHLYGRTDISSRTSTSGYSKNSSFGGSLKASASGPVNAAGIPLEGSANVGISGGVGKSTVKSNSSQQGTIKTSSGGSRNVMGSVLQDITDSTIQNSSNIRSLYSTVVVTDEQRESEQATTRNVTNYNHSHALTLQYYEVLQKYGILTKMDDYQVLLYMPFRPLRFNFQQIKNYWYLLKESVKLEDTALFDRYDTLINGGVVTEGFSTDPEYLNIESITVISNLTAPGYRLPLISDLDIKNHLKIGLKNDSGLTFQVIPNVQGVTQLNYSMGLERLKELEIIPAGLPMPPLNPNDQANFSINLIYDIKDLNTGKTIRLSKLYSSSIKFATLFNSSRSNTTINIAQNLDGDAVNEILNLITVSDVSLINEIEGYFARRRYYYTREIINGIESELLTDMFRNFYIGLETLDPPKRFSDFANPTPIGISDNYLLFEFRGITSRYADNSDLLWQRVEDMLDVEIRKAVALEVRDEVFLPTAGVFAEAILGRANSSEYINLRRFWNWQDSPIPNNAPAINPVVVQSRDSGIPDGINPNIPGSNLNIINPAPFQNPTSLDAALQAIQNGNMFRDMSKSEQLASSMKNLSELAKETAKQAGELSGKAREDALSSAVKMGQQVADMVGKESNQSNKPNNATEKGGVINEKSKKDSKEVKESVDDLYGIGKAPTGYGLSSNNNEDYLENIIGFEPYGSFDLLEPNKDGYGKYHINCHRGYFKGSGELLQFKEELVKTGYDTFVNYFSDTNIVIAEKSEYKYKNNPTIQFYLSIVSEPSNPHDDWVVIENHHSYFTAKTLKRNWKNNLEIAGGIYAPFGIEVLREINQRHFLAGTRSWSFGYDPDINDGKGGTGLYFFETAAIERFSHKLYDYVNTMTGGKMTEVVIEVWTKLIENWASGMNVELVIPPDYPSSNRNVIVFYEDAEPEQLNDLRETNWFKDVLTRHPKL